jgi:two-component system response regulator HydG
VVADLRLPDGNGIDLLRWMRKEGKMQPFIIMTDYAEVHTAVESMKLGSIDYIPKQLVEDKLSTSPFHTERATGGTTPYARVSPVTVPPFRKSCTA